MTERLTSEDLKRILEDSSETRAFLRKELTRIAEIEILEYVRYNPGCPISQPEDILKVYSPVFDEALENIIENGGLCYVDCEATGVRITDNGLKFLENVYMQEQESCGAKNLNQRDNENLQVKDERIEVYDFTSQEGGMSESKADIYLIALETLTGYQIVHLSENANSYPTKNVLKRVIVDNEDRIISAIWNEVPPDVGTHKGVIDG